MFLDLRDGAAPAEYQADICIIGAGAAGVAMAVALLPSKLKVLLVESGGFEFEPETQELYSGAIAGLDYGALDTARLRYFGGTTNHWEGYSAPLQPLDLARRDWVPLSGWPLTRETLDPFYARAHPILDLGPFDYASANWNDRFHRFNKTLPNGFKAELWQLSHPVTRMGQKYRDEIAQAGNVTALLHANATDIALSANGEQVDHVVLRTLSGRTARVRARAVVVACGGIENARLLLASRGVRPDGVGNDHGWVGRCFMEHVELREPAVTMLQGDMQWAFSFKNGHEPHHHIMHLRPDEGLQRQERILNVSLQMAVDLQPDPSSGYMALSRLSQGEGSWGDMFGDIGRALIDPGDVIDGIYSSMADEQYVPRLRAPAVGRVRIRSEQAPNPDSRVTLDDERDALGMPRVRLDWRLGELDRRTLARSLDHFAREIGRMGRGRVRIDEWITAKDAAWPDDLEWGYHHMGTTRMSADPRTGVVDADCKVHGVEGLYVAGSSVFPTGGYVNPTLTIVALALRLSDHLGAQLS